MKRENKFEKEEITNLWKNFNTSSKLLKDRLGRTSNLVGEYAEYLANIYLNGLLLPPSSCSADIKSINGDLYQVKSRKTSNAITTQLSIIRSWDFDYLTIILFDNYGSVLKGCIYPKSIAIKYAVKNNYQNGWVITTTKEFLEEENKIDITQKLRELNNDSLGNIKINSKKNINNFHTNNKSELKIGKYVQKTFKEIIHKIDTRELKNLQRADYSKQKLDIQYPFLLNVKESINQKPKRYWRDPVSIMGEFYYLCSEWYENESNNDRPYYDKWLKQMRINS